MPNVCIHQVLNTFVIESYLHFDWFCLLFRRYLKAALLPNSQHSIRTPIINGGVLKAVFGNSFTVPIALNKLYTKTLQVNVLNVDGQHEEIIVSLHEEKSLKIRKPRSKSTVFIRRAVHKSV